MLILRQKRLWIKSNKFRCLSDRMSLWHWRSIYSDGVLAAPKQICLKGKMNNIIYNSSVLSIPKESKIWPRAKTQWHTADASQIKEIKLTPIINNRNFDRQRKFINLFLTLFKRFWSWPFQYFRCWSDICIVFWFIIVTSCKRKIHTFFCNCLLP